MYIKTWNSPNSFSCYQYYYNKILYTFVKMDVVANGGVTRGAYLEGRDEEILYRRMRDDMIKKRKKGTYPHRNSNYDSTRRRTANFLAYHFRRCKGRNRQETEEADLFQAAFWVRVPGRRENCAKPEEGRDRERRCRAMTRLRC